MSAELTTEDIQALRQATSVSFHVNSDPNAQWPWCIKASYDYEVVTKAHINLFPETDIYRGRHRTIVISNDGTPTFDAFAMIHSSGYSQTWQTTTSLLRKGDVIDLSWKPDYLTNDHLRRNNLHGDVLQLVVRRGRKLYTFHVDARITPEDTARMVKRGGGQ